MENQKTDFTVIYRRYKDAFAGAILMIIFALIFIGANNIRTLVEVTINAAFWPRFISILGFILAINVFINGIKNGKMITALEQRGELELPKAKEKLFEGGNLRSILTLVLIALYMLLLKFLGWPVATVLYLYFQVSILTEKTKRKPIRIAIEAALFTAIVFILFRYAFMLMLPTGTLW